MNKKRFKLLSGGFDEKGNLLYLIKDTTDMIGDYEICKKVIEQQATIQKMKHSLNTIYKAFEKHYGYDMRNAVWLIDELSYDEIEDELYIAETDSKNRKEASMYWKKKVDEQKLIIEQLQKENKELKCWKKRIIEYLTNWFNKTEYLSVLYKINEINNEIGLDIDE